MIKSNRPELISTLNLTKTECPKEIRHYGSEWAVEEIKRAGLEMTQLNIADLEVLFQDGYAPVAAYEAYIEVRAAYRAAKETGDFDAGEIAAQAILTAYDAERRAELAPVTETVEIETQYEVVGEGFEHSVNSYSDVIAMINEYADDGRKHDPRSAYEVHEEMTWQRYSPNPQWLREIWIDDQCIAREVVNE